MNDLSFTSIYYLSFIIVGLFILWAHINITNEHNKYYLKAIAIIIITTSICFGLLFICNIISMETIWIFFICIFYPFIIGFGIIIFVISYFLKSKSRKILKLIGISLIIISSIVVLYCRKIDDIQMYRKTINRTEYRKTDNG